MSLDFVASCHGPLFATGAEIAEKLFDLLGLFSETIFLFTVVAIAGLAFKLPRGQRGQLRWPLFLLAWWLFFTLLLLFVREGTPFHSFLSGCGLFCLLGSLSLTLVLILAQVLDRTGTPLPRIAKDLLQMGSFCVILVIVLYRAGVDPAALLTGSAVLTVVLGIAMRDTLGNLIAGLSFQFQPPFQVGDWIQYDQTPQNIGRITEINWRATKIITTEDVEIILPNATLAQASIRNFSRPEKRVMRSIFVKAPLGIPPERVRRIILDTIRDIKGVGDQPAPSVMTNAFTDSEIEYWVRIFVEDFADRFKIESDVRDHIWYAFAREGVTNPMGIQPDLLESVGDVQERRRRQLAGVPIFAVLPEPALHQLAASVREQMFAPGEKVIRQGDEGRGLYLIELGEIVVTAREGSGPAVEVARLVAGSVFGEMSLLTGEPRNATATTVGECRLLLVDKSDFEPILLRHPDLAERISQVLVERQTARRTRLNSSAAHPEPEHKTTLFKRIREFFSL